MQNIPSVDKACVALFTEGTVVWAEFNLERFCKERGVKCQFVDIIEKGMNKGEFNFVV